MSYISNKFVRNTLQEPPKWGPIGQIVYLRTYSRWLQDQQRRERWDETVKRVVNYSVDLDPTMDKGEKIIEAERLFETIYKMRAFPSGRTMWVGGTEHSATNGQSMFNCAYTDVTSVVTLHDIVVLLMNGVGVGVGVRSDEVAKFKAQGKLNLSNIVVIKDYEYVGTPGTGGDQYTHNNAKHFTIHDSREGWAEFVRDFVYTYLFGEEESIYINVDNIRPEGTPLKTFGGRASGPQALIDFVNGFIQAVSDNDGINDVVLLDTVNLLGRMCVAGGSRRCYPSGTIVKTTDGPIEIQNIKVGMMISTPKGEKRVTNVFNQGVQETIAVNHAFGSFHCTPNHRVAVFTDINEWEFKEAQHLTTEDRLVWDFEPIPGTPQRLPTLEVMRTFDGSYVRNTGRATKPARYPETICSVAGCGRGSATLNGPHGPLCNAHYLRLKKHGDALKFRGWGRDVNLPEYIDTDLAWLVGYIHGNGHVMKISDSKGRLSISCPTRRPEIMDKVEAMLSKLCTGSKTTVDQGDGNWVNIMVSNARLVSWLHEYVKRPSQDITIPSFITMAEPEIRAAYLAGVFDSDGNIHKHNFTAVDTVHEGFATSIAKLYMTLGIGASVKRRERKEEGWSDISRVSIISSEFKDAAYVALKPYASTKLQDTVLNCKGSNTLTFKYKQSISAGVPSGRARAGNGNMSPAAVLEYTDVRLIAYPVPVISTTKGVTAQTWDIEVEDIHQFTAEGFVTHNSALAMLGDATSQDFINAKTGDYYEKYPWRGQANNSVVFYERPSVETIRSYFPAILQYGEPGFVNGQAAKNIRADWKGFNPCFEILLSDSGVCNLVSINFKYFAENQDEMHMFEETVRVIVRHNLRITNTTFNGVDPKWDLTQKRDRLLGVSFTGYGDAVDILGSEKPLQMLERMKQLVHDTAYEYADKMGIPRPLLSTTVKPEGSITLLYGASSGIHDVYAPYYIRRVRMGRTDALSVTLEQLGVPVEDDKFTPGLVVFSFPIKSAAIKSAGSKSAIEQLERYKDIMQTYVDHNASNTIYISKDEVEEVSQWVYDNWDTYIAVSFLPKMDSKYEQAPMEEIDEETYNKLAAQMPDLSDLHARLAEVEYEMSAGDELEGCDSGSCPIR